MTVSGRALHHQAERLAKLHVEAQRVAADRAAGIVATVRYGQNNPPEGVSSGDTDQEPETEPA